MNTTHDINFTAIAADKARISDKLTKINRLAARNGLGVATIAWGAPYDVTTKNEFGFDRIDTLVDGVMTAPKMGLDGWSLLATVDHSEVGNIIRSVPGTEVDVPVEFRSAPATRCDHCNAARLRSKTILVQHEDGSIKMLGSDCIRVYLGIDPSTALNIVDEVRSFDEDFIGFGRSAGPSVSEWMAVSAAVVTLYGWCSKATAMEFGKTSTSDIVGMLTGRITSFTKDRFPEFFNLVRDASFDDAVGDDARKVIARSNALAAEATAWALALPGATDFDHNVRTAVARTDVGRNGGLLTWVPEGYRRSVEQAEAKAAQAELPPSEYMGVEGDKVKATGCKVVFASRGEAFNYYGPASLYVVLVAADGTKLSLNTTVETKVGEALENAASDARFDLAGTIKQLKMYKGAKTTVITRAKILAETVA